MRRIGLIAGNGRLPVAFANSAKGQGYEVVAVSVTPAGSARLAGIVDRTYDISITQWGKVVDTLVREDCRDLFLMGKVPKGILFDKHDFDGRFLQVMSNLREKNDDAVILAFIEDLDREGLTVRNQTTFITDMVPSQGVLTARSPSEEEWNDVRYGHSMAKEIAGLDIGQTVVVKNGAVLAVEAIEGTDEAVRRGGRLGHEDTVVIKVSKPHQDLRFDIPTVGLDTMEAMLDSRVSCLCIDAGETFLVDRDQVLEQADAAGMTIVAVDPQEVGIL